ncbi:MAG: integration host factor subunit beta [Gammaproteobacteria bacterium]|nr:integration host factor subunit beta [Gammaproteobacteria bacterium]MYF53672.1 integration host factor subunit beta [Gammaproteobacteria bacterium]MYK44020.1 integration host factor subunit beta [Gammaproteobacteria bacterium]
MALKNKNPGLEKILATYPEYSTEQVEFYLQFIVQQMSDALVMAERIEVRGFGVFTLRRRVPRIGRNPQTGEQLMWPEAFLPHFKPSVVLKERVSNSS